MQIKTIPTYSGGINALLGGFLFDITHTINDNAVSLLNISGLHKLAFIT